MSWSLKEVTTPEDIRQFHRLPLKIYAHDPKWIRPLEKDVEAVFDPAKNKLLKKGSCSRWLLLQGAEVVGRVAAFINPKYKQTQPTGGMGFFECINNQDAAFVLFDQCKQWLQERGMEAMDGPINFGERDRWWGLVVEGYYEPLYCMNYNPPYYKTFFEAYGFQVYFYQECFGMEVRDDFSDKLIRRYESLRDHPQLQARHIEKKNWQKFARDFTIIYNKAWAGHGGGKTMDERQAIRIFKSMKPVMDEKINWFVYEGEEPIACWINLPDLNFYFKHLKGKFGLLQKLYFLYLKRSRPATKFVGIVFGVVPEWQGKGIDTFMIIEGARFLIPRSRYRDYEMQWIGDFNPKMTNIAYGLGATVSRRLATYRYLFDRSLPFERHPIL